MPKFSTVSAATVVAIALYFALGWGYESVEALTSPSYGLNDVWRSQVIFAAGRIAGFGPVGFLKLAAFLAALKLAVAAICGLHVLNRLRSLGGGRTDPAALEAALSIAICIGVASAAAALWSNNTELLRDYFVQSALACLAIALCATERMFGSEDIGLEPVQSTENDTSTVARLGVGPTIHP